MNFYKKVKKIILNGTESKVTRQGMWISVLRFRLFVRNRHGDWMQITENTKLDYPVCILYDTKKGGGLVSPQDSSLCEFTDAMLFWEDTLISCNLLCFTKEEDAEAYNILKVSVNGKSFSKLFDKLALWVDSRFLHSNLLGGEGGDVNHLDDFTSPAQ